jgi:hypothetical protein
LSNSSSDSFSQGYFRRSIGIQTSQKTVPGWCHRIPPATTAESSRRAIVQRPRWLWVKKGSASASAARLSRHRQVTRQGLLCAMSGRSPTDQPTAISHRSSRLNGRIGRSSRARATAEGYTADQNLDDARTRLQPPLRSQLPASDRPTDCPPCARHRHAATRQAQRCRDHGF